MRTSSNFTNPIANTFARTFAVVSALCIATSIAYAQTPLPRPNPTSAPTFSPPRTLPSRAEILNNDDRSGPRVGVAYIVGGSVTAENEGRSFTPLTSLFGWQIERQFPTGRKDTPVPMTEFVVLVGGLEQGAFLPSASWMLGLRQPNGWEAGVGPTITGAGVQLAFAAGITQTLGNLNIPVNLAVAPGRRGAAISITTGFNTR